MVVHKRHQKYRFVPEAVHTIGAQHPSQDRTRNATSAWATMLPGKIFTRMKKHARIPTTRSATKTKIPKLSKICRITVYKNGVSYLLSFDEATTQRKTLQARPPMPRQGIDAVVLRPASSRSEIKQSTRSEFPGNHARIRAMSKTTCERRHVGFRPIKPCLKSGTRNTSAFTCTVGLSDECALPTHFVGRREAMS